MSSDYNPTAEFRHNLRAARLAAGLTQADLAEAVGSYQMAICHMEKGEREPKARELWLLAAALGVSPVELAEGDRAGRLKAELSRLERECVAAQEAVDAARGEYLAALRGLEGGGDA